MATTDIATTIYDIGDRPTLIATFYDPDDNLADPTGITFTLVDPSGNAATGDENDATNPSVGVWKWPIPAAFDEDGWWTFRAEATSGLQTAAELQVEVRPSLVV